MLEEVFVLQHEEERWDRDSARLLGVFPHLEAARDALNMYAAKPPFSDWPDGFSISRYPLSELQWSHREVVPITVHVLWPFEGRARMIAFEGQELPDLQVRVLSPPLDETGRAIIETGRIVPCVVVSTPADGDMLLAAVRG